MTARIHAIPQRPDAVARMIAGINARLAAIAGVVQPEPADDLSPPDWAIDALARALALGPFEQQAVTFAAAAELVADTRALVAKIGEGPPSVGLLMRVCEGLDWSALRPDGALRRAMVLKLGHGEARFSERPVMVEEAVLHFLNRVQQLDPLIIDVALPGQHDAAAPVDDESLETIAHWFARYAQSPLQMPLIEIVCDEPRDGIALAIAALRDARLGAVVIPVSRLPRTAADAATLRAVWLRDSLLHGLGLVLVNDDRADLDAAQVMAGWPAPALVVGQGEQKLLVPALRVAVASGRRSQRAAWAAALGPDGAARHEGIIDRMAFGFRLSGQSIATLAEQHRHAESEILWQAARSAARPRNANLLERFEPRARLWDVVLPDDARTTLETLVAAARAHHRIFSAWGAGDAGCKGLGIAALFSGESGTGKTMAAEAIAGALNVDLYRVEVSAVVSKYIGETEKNLRAIFAAGEASGGVLLFDEADVIFGKRAEVQDAHDRYANMEVGYLLQLMESYRGLAILTTNMDGALDSAFMRRLRFVVRFPLPGPDERRRIWESVFPEGVATDTLDHSRLARLAITGGVIHNIALGASFRAADGGGRVTISHILDAARAEYVKLGRPLAEIDQKDWS
jgi:hypothetical protein